MTAAVRRAYLQDDMTSWRWVNLALVAAAACGESAVGDGSGTPATAVAELLDLPPGFPTPSVPTSNPLTQEKIDLGRYLFYDVRLSGNRTQSCSSCHDQRLAFADGQRVPVGSTGDVLHRNSQGLTNVAYNANLTWASSLLDSIEEQTRIPLFAEHPVELGVVGNETEIIARLSNDETYRLLFAAAYPDVPNPVEWGRIVQSLASFVRSLISGDSRFDRFTYQNDAAALTESERRGARVFFSEVTECHHCHGGFNFTLSTVHTETAFEAEDFHNTGLYNVDGAGGYPLLDQGLFDVTEDPRDMGKFRAPSLRNVELTAPYMHDGSVATLEEVIRIYEAGGRDVTEGDNAGDGRDSPLKSGFVQGFTLTDEERADLLAFLGSLTDEVFVTDPRFSNPFEAQ